MSSHSSQLWNDDTLTRHALRGLPGVMAWIQTLPEDRRRQLCAALVEASAELAETVERVSAVLESPETLPEVRAQTLSALEQTLFRSGSPPDLPSAPSQQTEFTQRLRHWMERRGVTQQELAEKLQISQPAISQLLTRKRRPQKQTILALAQALQIEPTELWPDLEVAEMLDAVAKFQEDGELSEAEAKALRDSGRRSRPRGDDGPRPISR